MQKFTIKAYKDTFEYEICDYSFDAQKYLKITKYYKNKFYGEESIDLSEINPEFLEVKCKKTPVAALIAAWLGVVFLAGTCMIMGIAIIFEKDLLLSASCLFIPLTVGIYSLNYIIQQRKIKAISEFIFCDKEFSRFQIPYMAQDRSKACAFARKIANFCNHSLYEKNECPCITHQFSNGLAELRDTRVVVFNKDGIKCGDCDYISIVPGLHHHRESQIFSAFLQLYSFGSEHWCSSSAQQSP